MKKYLLILTSALLLLVFLTPPASSLAQSQPPTAAEITTFLNEHPLIADSGGEVLSVRYVGEALVIDLSAAILPDGVYDDALFTTLQADLDAALHINQSFMLTFKIEGKPLEDWGRPLPDFSETAEPPLIRELPGDGPLKGYKIALSPGHGLYWNETYSDWMYQRGEFWGIREDTLNSEIMRYLQAALLNQGATVIQTREMDPDARTGITGYPAWHEDSRQYGIYLSLPEWVWNGSNNNYNSDIRSRPYMANYYEADVLISFHNNGWDGTLRGTETYWDYDNNAGSHNLAIAVHNSIINTMIDTYGSWTNRGIKTSYDDYGEINYAQMPAALVELAFMDNYQDNLLLHEESFKLLAANAIADGICDFLSVNCEDADTEMPVTLETPTLTPAYGSGMCDSGWYRYTNQRGAYAYLALNAYDEGQSANLATWAPSLPISGEYRLEVFIPDHNVIAWSCPSQTVQWDTSGATYTITHANGTSTVTVNQAPQANDWVDLGIFHFDADTLASISLSDVTKETTQTTTVSASAARFTLVGNAGVAFHNTDFIPGIWLDQEIDATTSNIRHFMEFYRSCLEDPILDSDGVSIDVPDLIQQAAAANGINPKLLLAIMEAKQGALTTCPDDNALANLMGLSPASTAREQIAAVGSQLGIALETLNNTGETPNGWTARTAKTTLDGVTVTPANDSIAFLFDYFQNAGETWGGTTPGEDGVWAAYIAYRDFHLDISLPEDVHYYFTPLLTR